MQSVDPELQNKAKRYARLSRRLWLVNTILSTGYVLAWMIFGWATACRDWLVASWPLLANPWLMVAAFALVFGGIFLVLELPMSYWGGFWLPHRFGQSTQSFGDWALDQLKGILISVPIGLMLLELLYLALRVMGDAWWLWATLGLVIFNVLLSNLAPILILPLFNRYVPLGDEHKDLSQRLLRLAEQARTQVRGVYKFDMSKRTRAANAALTGIGNTRRIVLGDTLINEFTPDEIETVLAHELGHHVHRDILLLIVVGSIHALFGLYLASVAMEAAVRVFGFAGIGDIASLPALGLILGMYGLLTSPIENAILRWRERMADGYALKATGKNMAFASALARLANQNLGEVDPERWVVLMFYSHPPLAERIKDALAWSSATA